MSADERSNDFTSWGVSPDAQGPEPTSPKPAMAEHSHDIIIDKAVIVRDTDGVLSEIFTMTVGNETIQLVPFKNWTQLDVFKWRARGVLPRTPAGLEITWEHVKVAGETVSPWDGDACAKLEKALSEWLAVERQAVELAKAKAQAPVAQPPVQADEDTVHFQVEVGTAAQPRLKCLEGNQTVKVVALNAQGLNALIEEGLMRKPGSLKVGALHDWVELDGELFRFKDGEKAASELEQALNQKYIVTGDSAEANDVAVYPNPASPTGFDIQFPAAPTGLVENRKRHLNEETVQLLADPERCRVLRKGLTVKFTSPDLVFKLKTPDGGEAYLEPGPETTVTVPSDDGHGTKIDLSRPVSLLNLGVRELTAVFNHPAINRRARLAQTSAGPSTDIASDRAA